MTGVDTDTSAPFPGYLPGDRIQEIVTESL